GSAGSETSQGILGRVGHAVGVRRIPLLVAMLACSGFVSNSTAAPAFRDRVVAGGADRAPAAIAEWGGPTVATDGETVTLYFSDSHPVDPSFAKQWADFMTSLVHGSELQTATIHLLTEKEVQVRCGIQA